MQRSEGCDIVERMELRPLAQERKEDKMAENSSCSNSGCERESCNGCEKAAESMKKECNEFSNVKHVVGVMSGKGGVGKSMVTASMAVSMARKGYKVGILDADLTGPSIPKMFGISERAQGVEEGILPAVTPLGIKIMSINLLLETEESPVIWRGPVIAGMVSQFWTDVLWGDLDYLFVDMPPGTGDVPLTVFQSLPVDGAILVTSPQSLVEMIVKKAYNMAQMMHVSLLGIVENFSYFQCPDCGGTHAIFGDSRIEEIGKETGLSVLAKLPIRPEVSRLADEGAFEDCDCLDFSQVDAALETLG